MQSSGAKAPRGSLNRPFYILLESNLRKNLDTTKYDSRISVRKNNRAVDKYRKVAMLIGEKYPDLIDQFAENMNDENEGIRLRAAVCLIELMPHTKAHLSKAKTIIVEHVAHHLSIPETDIGWNWWLSQPWAEESNCTDY